MHCVAGPLPYRICQIVKIAIMAGGSTTGYRRRARIVGIEVRTALFVLNDISSAENAVSAASVVAPVGNMRR